jgi:hypothetical protein
MRRRTSTALLAAGVIALGLIAPTSAFASHSEVSLAGSNFEIDTNANLKVDDAGSLDWANVANLRKADTTSGSADESFGNGTKEDTASPSVVDGGIPPNKSDLKDFGLYQEGSTSNGFLNLYWTRVQDPSGTTNMDFEFNHRQCTPGLTPADVDCAANGLTPIRSAGDLLITYDLSRGGTVATISMREWTGSVWGAAEDLTVQNKAAGSINTTAIPAGDSDGIGALSPRTFGEAQIDLSTIFEPGTCESFGSAYLKSRASDSFTAALKDFVPPAAVNITNCGSVEINKTDDAVPGNPLAGATFTLYKDVAPIGGSRGAGDVITSPALSCTTDAAGECTISNVLFGTYWVVETTTPAGYDSAPDTAINVVDTVAVVLNLVDPRIVLTPNIATAQSFVPNDDATITVGTDNGALSGYVVFELFTNLSCTAPAAYTSGHVTVAETGTPDGSVTVSSNNQTAYSTSGVFAWKVTFVSTNPGHTGQTSSCLEQSSITIDNDVSAP